MDPVILYRDLGDWKYESEAASKYFKCYSQRSEIPNNNLVIPRYSALPFYRELETDLANRGCKMINSYRQHRYVANMGEWYYDLKDYTPRTWNQLHLTPEQGPFVLKGETNSKKNWWKTSMFAETKADAIRVHSLLCADSLIGDQDIFIREYVPLHTYMEGIQGQPITKEFRFFVCYGEVLCGAFYWSNYVDEIEPKPDVNDVPRDFLEKVINIVSENINFFVVDVAETQSGDWIVIELNDGQMSGISENDPEQLYGNLAKVLEHV